MGHCQKLMTPNRVGTILRVSICVTNAALYAFKLATSCSNLVSIS